MDVLQKLKNMSERASRENFAFRFYKSGETTLDQTTHVSDRSFKEVEWFSHKKAAEPATQGGTLELASPMINRGQHSQVDRRSSSMSKKLSTTHHLHQSEIINSLEQREFQSNQDLKSRSTKIICTLGRITKQVEPIKKMIKKGMDVARINMNYFELHEQVEIINNIKQAASQSGKQIPILVDLKGPLIRTLGFKDMYSIPVKAGQEIRLSSNQQILGDEGMFIIDYDNIHEKLCIGDKIIVDYGAVVMTVIGFESEEKYLKNQLRKQRKLNQYSPEENSNGIYYDDLQDSGKKKYGLKRKLSAKEDEVFQEEIEELINEENQDDEEFKDMERNLTTNFPKVPNLDSGNIHRISNEDLRQEKAMIDEILKKRHQGINANSFAKIADQARYQTFIGKKVSRNQHQSEQTLFSETKSEDYSPLQKSNSLIDYQMKRLTTEECKDSGSNDHHFNPQQIQFSNNPKELPPSKKYLNRKRMSRDEFQRDKLRLFKGLKKQARSRKSTSPSHRNTGQSAVANNDHNISFSISESDTQSLMAKEMNVDKNIQSADLNDYSTPLYQKERMLVVCRIENDGDIKENKPLYIPNLDWQKDLRLSVLGPKDIKVLHNSIQQGVHVIAVSFVESKEDITYVKKVLGPKGSHIKVLAKLQSKKAIENFDQILEVCDGVIIARGYLGLTLDLEDVVYVQKYVIKKCNIVGKPVILSTQIMESMVSRLIPSRAEVVDISNAVYDGIDSLILSPETAIGTFYEQATKKMADICFEAEKHINYLKRYQDQELLIKSFYGNASKEQLPYQIPSQLWSTEETISSCAVKASFDVKASLIIVFTHSGITARKVAKHKPKCMVLAVTPNDWAAKAVLLHRGIEAMMVGSLVGSDTLINKVLEEAIDRKMIKKGDFVIVTSGLSGTVGSTNLLKIIKV